MVHNFLVPVLEVGHDVNIFCEYFRWNYAVVDAVGSTALVY
jgi:hypothetical protein